MKKSFICLLLLCSTPAFAEMDPFSVYTAKAPEGCVDAPSKKGEFTLPELIQIGICNNPTLNRSYMSIKSSEANLGQA
ncbi:MAG: hypothetical protein IKS41_00460, partial [Alphaproteobacteria bacterium]|nr:hypothetical protein [Alphaproteobacteria bacterium]